MCEAYLLAGGRRRVVVAWRKSSKNISCGELAEVNADTVKSLDERRHVRGRLICRLQANCKR